LTDKEKRKVLCAVVVLMEGFKNGEEAHRAQWGLDVGKQQREAVSGNPQMLRARERLRSNENRMGPMADITLLLPTLFHT
jgi:hypothetical protein